MKIYFNIFPISSKQQRVQWCNKKPARQQQQKLITKRKKTKSSRSTRNRFAAVLPVNNFCPINIGSKLNCESSLQRQRDDIGSSISETLSALFSRSTECQRFKIETLLCCSLQFVVVTKAKNILRHWDLSSFMLAHYNEISPCIRFGVTLLNDRPGLGAGSSDWRQKRNFYLFIALWLYFMDVFSSGAGFSHR